MSIWERLFGEPFAAVIVFLYWLDGPVALAGEERVFRFEGRSYAHRAVALRDYARVMKPRSPRWGTVDLPAEAFERLGTDLRGWFEGDGERPRGGFPPALEAFLEGSGGVEGRPGGEIGVGVGAGVGVGSGGRA